MRLKKNQLKKDLKKLKSTRKTCDSSYETEITS
jgi:hypothetical protein